MPLKDNSTHFDSISSIDTLLAPQSLYNRDFPGPNSTYNVYDGLPLVSFNNIDSRGGRINRQKLCAILDVALELINEDDEALQEMGIDAEIESLDRPETSPTNEPPQD
jgi:hypothetical protein